MVEMLLTGTFVRTMDENCRFCIPRPIRQSLKSSESNVFYAAPGTDGSLALYPEQAFAAMADQLGKAPPTGPDVRAFSRLFYAQAQRVEMDGHGRLRLPAELAALANLGKEVVLIGVRDHLELWNQERWEEYLSQKQAQYDEIAEKAFGGGPQEAPESEPRPTKPR